MESGGEDLDNIFEEYESHENGETAENSENKDSTESSAGVRVAPPRRIIKNPRLKFNAERLCGERGIPVLMDHFKNVKFKGKGHEKEDLDKLLASLEHWTHRLYPSMKFADCLHQIEKLGKKRPVQTCLRKIRLDMPILNSDFVKDDEEDHVLRNGDPDPIPSTVDAFDRLIEESQDILSSNTLSAENAENNSISSSPVPNETRGQVLGLSFGPSLTEEQKERMQRNRLLAAERRKAKLAASQINTSDSQSVNDNVNSSQNNCSANGNISKQYGSVDSIQNSTFSNASLDGEINNCNERSNQKSSAPNNNSDDLGLDDLIDLVDDEIAHDKNVTTKIPELTDEVYMTLNVNKENISEETGISLEETVPSNISNSSSGMNMDSVVNVINEDVETHKVYESAGEMLGLESMMDLVDEEEPLLKQDTGFDSHIGNPKQNFKSMLHNDASSSNCNGESLQNMETENSASILVDD